MKILAIILSLCYCSCVIASTDLYQTDVSLANRSESAQKQALPLALVQVLQKVSGNRQLNLQQPWLKKYVQDASQLVESTAIVELNSNATLHSKVLPLRLSVRFQEAAINNILRLAGQPLWLNNRPTVVVWAVREQATETGAQRHYAWLDSDQEYRLRSYLDQVGMQRGVRLEWGAPDLLAQTLPHPQMVAEGDEVALRNATADPAVDKILLCLVFLNDGTPMRGNARVLLPKTLEMNPGLDGAEVTNTREFQLQGKHFDELSQTLIHSGIDQMATRYAQSDLMRNSVANQQMELMITGVKANRDYQNLLAYINSLGVIHDAHVIASYPPDRVLISLSVEASLSQLFANFKAQKKVQINQVEDPDSAVPRFAATWVG